MAVMVDQSLPAGKVGKHLQRERIPGLMAQTGYSLFIFQKIAGSNSYLG
jgi:hypothetical protein